MYSESLGQQVQEERIVFGLIADRTANHTLTELVNTYQYSSYDVSTIAREVSAYLQVPPLYMYVCTALHHFLKYLTCMYMYMHIA